MTRNLWHWIIDEPNLTPNEKLVAVTIKRHQAGERIPWPSPDRIARLSGLSRRTVYRAIGTLEKKGALTIIRAADGFVRYNVEQRQGLLFSSANASWKRCGNLEGEMLKPAGASATQTQASATQAQKRVFEVHSTRSDSNAYVPFRKKEDRITPEDRKTKSAHAHTARGSSLRKIDAKTNRLLGDIARIRATLTGAGPSDRDDILRGERKIELIRAELRRCGWQDERVG